MCTQDAERCVCHRLIVEFAAVLPCCCWCVQDGIIAAKRIDMSKKGVETCGDVDEVRAAGLLGLLCM